MTTLADLKIKYASKPVTLAAITRAIQDHGETAEAVISQGLPSTNPRSNLAKRTTAEGYKTYNYYVGARAGKYANDGNYNVIVKTS